MDKLQAHMGDLSGQREGEYKKGFWPSKGRTQRLKLLSEGGQVLVAMTTQVNININLDKNQQQKINVFFFPSVY